MDIVLDTGVMGYSIFQTVFLFHAAMKVDQIASCVRSTV